MGQRALPSSVPTPPRLCRRHRTALASPPAPVSGPHPGNCCPFAALQSHPDSRMGAGQRQQRAGEWPPYFQVHGVFIEGPRKWFPPRGELGGRHPSPEVRLYGLQADGEEKRAISLQGDGVVSCKLRGPWLDNRSATSESGRTWKYCKDQRWSGFRLRWCVF